MQINIASLNDKEVTVSGQVLSKEFAGCILLPLLVAQCGSVQGRRIQVVEAFANALVSIASVPEAANEYRLELRHREALQAQRVAEANAHAERCREWTPQELAQRNADRDAREAAIREHGQLIRAGHRSSNW